MDLAILHWIQANLACPFLDWLMPLVSAAGDHGLVWIATAVVLFAYRPYRKWGVFMILAVLCAWLVGEQLVKPLVGRSRPFLVDPSLPLIVAPPSGYSMPSGHTLSAFCAATVLLFSPIARSGKATAAVVAVLIGFSRLYLCVHNPTDVVAGAVFGTAFGLAGGWAARSWRLDLAALWRARGPRVPVGAPEPLMTTWGEGIVADLGFPGRAETFVPLAEHPDPQFARESSRVLNGLWDYAIVRAGSAADAAIAWRDAEPPRDFDGKILVPFSPEAPLSGAERGPRADELIWYRRVLDSTDLPQGERWVLHFGAVDHACACYVNGVKAGLHAGGYLPFSFDVTEALVEGGNEILVCAHDPGEQGLQPRGRQRTRPHGIWHTGQSGIWQTVWVEGLPENHLLAADLSADLAGESLAVTAHVSERGERLGVVVRDPGGAVVARQSVVVSFDRPSTPELVLHVPHPRPWSPEDPCLYGVELSYGADRVGSYCAFRSAEVRRDDDGTTRFFLNREPRYLRGVLDQGYWPDGLMTAPSDEALAFDVERMRGLGFDMLRKHVKVESARWYYHCDRLGMLVWQDLPSGGAEPGRWTSTVKPTLFRRARSRYDDTSAAHCARLGSQDEVYRKQWREDAVAAVRHLKGHPCIVTWSLFNEGWGQFSAVAAASLVRGADSTRPIDAASGWYDQGCGDYLSVHERFRDLEVSRDARGRDGEGAHLAGPAARDVRVGRAFVLTDMGGLSLHVPGHSSYARPCGHDDLGSAVRWRSCAEDLLTRAEKLEAQGGSGFVFAQLSDVEQETDGILTYDRRVCKLDAPQDPASPADGNAPARPRDGEAGEDAR